jgi:hypothetical protein
MMKNIIDNKKIKLCPIHKKFLRKDGRCSVCLKLFSDSLKTRAEFYGGKNVEIIIKEE